MIAEAENIILPPKILPATVPGIIMPPMGQIWCWREAEAEPLWREARRALSAGLIIALPTETYYALAVHPFQEEALSRLYLVKDRPAGKPVLLLVAHREMLSQVAADIPAAAHRLMDRFWPGPLTLILPARPILPRRLAARGTIAVRQPAQPLTCRLIAVLGFPVTGTSANRAGQAPLTAASAVAWEFGGQVELILDDGPTPGGPPSSIVDVTTSPPALVRPGAVAAAALRRVIPEITGVPAGGPSDA